MKLFTAILFLFSAAALHAQHVKCTTSEFTVSGAVKQSQTITVAALDSFKVVDIPTMEITNHKGEKKSAIKGMKGI
jgi:hypothetical protein